MSVRRLKSNKRDFITREDLNTTEVYRFPTRGMNIISESAVYKLVMSSRKPEAVAFQDWIAETVLPAIRKDGDYVMTEEDHMEMSLRMMDMLRKKLDEKSQQLGTGSRECC